MNRDIDILFLIDDSPSMADKQRNIGQNFPNFINVLNTIQGGLPNVHIGVTTSDGGSQGADDSGPGPNVGSPGTQGGCFGKGKGGVLQTYASAGGVMTTGGAFLSDVSAASGSGRTQNFTGDLATAFQQVATAAGVAGCGFEQHLEMAKQALNPMNSTTSAANAGFLRDDAFLAVIILGDEDDCSMAHTGDFLTDNASIDGQLGPLESFRCTRFGVTCDQGGTTPDEMNQIGAKGQCHSNEDKTYLTDVQRYVDFFHSVKTDPNSVIVADIGGPSTPVATETRTINGQAQPALAHSCNYTDPMGGLEVADPTVRVSQFINAFPNRSTFQTICTDDLSDGLTLIAQLLKSVVGSPCIDGVLADVDPNTPGPQYDCSVSDVTDPGKADQTESIIPECDNQTSPDSSSSFPCWAIQMNAECTTGTGLALYIARNGVNPPMEDHVIANCVTTGGGGSGSD
nr:hypothetical protein [Kofleriaceae bacterium]